ncbi:MAG: hypothetical protein ACYTAF_09945 [Planctomycetota bacterium]|jgi:heme/copper-type cytochrome/quinol oxidase subunit 4
MKQIFGALLLLIGALFLFQFGIHGTFHAPRDVDPSFALPFKNIGANWPTDAIYFVLAIWLTIIGLGLCFSTGKAGAGRVCSKIMLLNSLLMLTALFMAYTGARGAQDYATIGAFFAIAGIQIVFGLLLLLLALGEKPKGTASLLAGTLFWIAGAAVGVMSFLSSGQPNGAQ